MFEFEVSWFDSFIEYERQVTRNLRQLQRLRWLDRKHGQERVAAAELERIEEEIKAELRKVRRAVDGSLLEGSGRPRTVAAMRASPQRPNGVVEYRDLASFVAENCRRAVSDWPRREDAAGADFGHCWQLENPFRRWEATSWRISLVLRRIRRTGGDAGGLRVGVPRTRRAAIEWAGLTAGRAAELAGCGSGAGRPAAAGDARAQLVDSRGRGGRAGSY